MTFIEYWSLVVVKFPHLANEDDKTTIKISSLKAFIKQSHEHGVDLGKNVEKFKNMDKKDDSYKGFGDLFGGLWKK